MIRTNNSAHGITSDGNNTSTHAKNGKACISRGDSYQIHIDATAEMVKSRFFDFLCNFGHQTNNHQDRNVLQDISIPQDSFNYSTQAQVMRNSETSSLFVDFAHILDHDPDLAHALYAQYYRWEPYLRRSVFEFMQMEDSAYTINDDANKSQREFFVCFYNFQHVFSIRDLRMQSIGELVSFSGTVTRTSEVRPELLFGAFTCSGCGGDTVGVEQQFKYTEPVKCQNPFCANISGWEMNTEKSVFVDWQRVKVQENSDEIPAGSMPRSMDVILRHENVDQAKAGDRVVFTGTLIVVPDVSKLSRLGGENVVAERTSKGESGTKGMEGEGVRGLRALGVRELTYKTCFLACSVQTMEQRFNTISIRNEYGDEGDGDHAIDFTEQELATVQSIRQDPDRYHKMAKSICPSIYGHDEIRKGILLMLLGGVHKSTPEGINLRGDINICIVGDPSTAKSQFLKYICTFLPRAIYTSGKVSSAAGLTASVTRDVDTGEYCVEAGALMLADNGICCIDEFDKMDTMDQVAIHEAMEQQTISITKAGIQATLNARTSILAAANPYNGRYDRTKSLKYNVNISAPIMSRFDLFFVVLDECEPAIDQRIAEHIVNTHMPLDLQVQAAREAVYSEDDLKRYIRYARTLNPTIPEDAKRMMVTCYRSLRENDVVSNGQANIAYRITVRQLESMIRLSEALARMDLSAYVLVEHVEEAYRLLSKSIIHVDTPNVSLKIPKIRMGTQVSATDAPALDEANERTNGTDSSIGKSIDQDESVATDSGTMPSETLLARQNISFERFAVIQKSIGKYIRGKEEDARIAQLRNDDNDKKDAKSDTDDIEVEDFDIGVMQGELVTWYLSSQDITSEAQLAQEKDVINSVIERLIRDKFLVLIQHGDDEKDGALDENDEGRKQERYLAIHPKYSF